MKRILSLPLWWQIFIAGLILTVLTLVGVPLPAVFGLLIVMAILIESRMKPLAVLLIVSLLAFTAGAPSFTGPSVRAQDQNICLNITPAFWTFHQGDVSGDTIYADTYTKMIIGELATPIKLTQFQFAISYFGIGDDNLGFIDFQGYNNGIKVADYTKYFGYPHDLGTGYWNGYTATFGGGLVNQLWIYAGHYPTSWSPNNQLAIKITSVCFAGYPPAGYPTPTWEFTAGPGGFPTNPNGPSPVPTDTPTITPTPSNSPTNLYPPSDTNTPTPSDTLVPTYTRTPSNTPVPSLTLTPIPSDTVGAGTDTPTPRPSYTNLPSLTALPPSATGIGGDGATLASGAFNTLPAPNGCGDDPSNPCGVLPFNPPVLKNLDIHPPTSLPRYTIAAIVVTPSGTSGTGTPIGFGTPNATVVPLLTSASGIVGTYTALGAIAIEGPDGTPIDFAQAGNEIGSKVGAWFSIARGFTQYNFGKIGVLLAFLIMVLGLMILVRVIVTVVLVIRFIISLVQKLLLMGLGG